MTREEAKRELLFAKREVMADSYIDKAYDVAIKALEQHEIIRCKDCKNWAVQVKDVNGDGLGSCKFHKANFVTGEGYCYWAERREEEVDWRVK